MLADLIKKYILIGTKLWSPLYGDCNLVVASPNFIISSGDRQVSLTDEGKYTSSGEVMVFPSKRVQSWQVLDFVEHEAQNNHLYTLTDCIGNSYIGRFNKVEGGVINFYYVVNSCNHITRDFSMLLTEARLMNYPSTELIKEHLASLKVDGLTYTSTNKLVKMKPQFKPFQKVLVRDSKSEPWHIGIFSYIDETSTYKYRCIGCGYSMCIPYEGNEHLCDKAL